MNRYLLLLLWLPLWLSACHIDESEKPTDPAALAALQPAPANLYTIDLPAGDVGSINIAWFRNGATFNYDPATWLDKTDESGTPYVGVRFVGKGQGVTNIRCTSWDGITLAVKQHQGIVQVEHATIYYGYNQATQIGEQNTAKKLSPNFGLRLIDCAVIATQIPSSEVIAQIARAPEEVRASLMPQRQQLTAPTRGPPASANETERNTFAQVQERIAVQPASMAELAAATMVRPKWGLFGYQADLYVSQCRFNGKEAVEHDSYFHGFSHVGAIVEDSTFEAAGAECFKVRPDQTETVAVPGTSIVLRRCKFQDWYQDWSWRGGCAIVLQGGASNVLIEQCFFKGGRATAMLGSNMRSHAIEIVAEANSWGGDYGNGHVLIRGNAAYGRSDVDWNNTLVRIARNSGTQSAARSATIENSGLYGPKMLVAVSQVPTGKASVTGCNTETIRQKLASLFDTSVEAKIPTSIRMVPVSEGRTW